VAEDLRSMLDSMAERGYTELDEVHGGELSHLYRRAIKPRRLAKQWGIGLAGAAAAAALVFGGAAVLGTWEARQSEPMAPRPADTTPPPTIDDLDDARTGLVGASDWEIASTALDAGLAPAPFVPPGGSAWGALEACRTLGLAESLDGSPELGGTGVWLGGFAVAGGTNAVHGRAFDTEDDADAYVSRVEALAEDCSAALAGDPVGVAVSATGLTGVRGEGARVRAESEGATWTLWVHVDGADALAVAVEPGAEDRATEIIGQWVWSR